MRRIFKCFLLALFLAPVRPQPLHSQDGYASPILAGISNHGRTGRDPYVTAGDRAYLIGTQDGDFPDLGDHVPGEMAGLWVHPIKLLDGFWATVREGVTGRRVRLEASKEFINQPYGNRLRYGPLLDSLDVERFQFSPDGYPAIVVQYIFSNSAGRERQLSLELTARTDLLPVWLSERIGLTDAPDTVSWSRIGRLYAARDTKNPWFAVWGTPGAAAEPAGVPEKQLGQGQGLTATSRHLVSVGPGATDTLTFVFTGSNVSQEAAENTYRTVASNRGELLTRKASRYASLIESGRIAIPNRRLQEVYDWVRVNTAWLVRDVPGIGRGLGAGMMEYPWWFGTDGAYTLQATLATGQFDLVKQNLRLLRDQSAKVNGNGRIIHEVSTNGVVFNPGNTQETSQFIMTVGKAIAWSGDREFAREMYPAMKQGIDWLMSDMDKNGDLFPEGYGIMEVKGLNAELIDVAVYTQQALVETARVAEIVGEPKEAGRYSQLASRLADRINQRFWVPEDRSYGDFYATRAEALSVADGAIEQIRSRPANQRSERDSQSIAYYEKLKQRFAKLPEGSRAWLTNKNWVISTPMEVGIAPRERAIALLDKVRRENTGEYGPYLSAVERQAMMTISTGVQAVAEGSYGRMDQAMWYVDRIVDTFNRKLPGSISEMMPDYGCFTQGWTMYGIVVPLVEQVFGIRPDAVNKAIVFEPHLPSGWEDISIRDLPVGTNRISFSRRRTDQGIEYLVEAREGGWNFTLKGVAVPGASYYLNGQPVHVPSSGIQMSGQRNQVLIATSGNN